jgi:hypothetical protein
MENIGYSKVTGELLSAVPEFRERFNRELAQWKPPELPGPYVVFSFVVKPALRDLLTADRQPVLLRRIFDFFEGMASSSDVQVPNLLGIEICEWLVGDPLRLSIAWQYMGEETRKLTRNTARSLRRESNIPAQ